jgi:hypothetical protein
VRALVTVLGFLYAGMGAVFFASPPMLERFLAFWQQGIRPYIVVVGLRLLTGAVLVATAPQCRLPRVMLALGILFLVSGLGALLIGADGIRWFWQWASAWPPTLVRLGSLVLVGLGVLLLYAAA